MLADEYGASHYMGITMNDKKMFNCSLDNFSAMLLFDW